MKQLVTLYRTNGRFQAIEMASPYYDRLDAIFDNNSDIMGAVVRDLNGANPYTWSNGKFGFELPLTPEEILDEKYEYIYAEFNRRELKPCDLDYLKKYYNFSVETTEAQMDQIVAEELQGEIDNAGDPYEGMHGYQSWLFSKS